MGGYGSGRQFGKNTTNAYRRLDVRSLQRDGLLTPGHAYGWNWSRDGKTLASIQIQTGADRITLIYRHRRSTGEWKDENYPVQLEWTGCNYGGGRAWFNCPADGCGRRVALLYLGGSGIFACRHCYRLAYACQRKSANDRAMGRADSIRGRLGWEPGILNEKGWKPKGMHWRTFERLTAEHDAFVGVTFAGLAKRFGLKAF